MGTHAFVTSSSGKYNTPRAERNAAFVPSEMPRAYEVAGQLIKNVADATDKLLDLQKKLKDVEAEEKVKGPSTVNNALFVGSTADLAKMLKDMNKEEDK